MSLLTILLGRNDGLPWNSPSPVKQPKQSSRAFKLFNIILVVHPIPVVHIAASETAYIVSKNFKF